MYRLTKLSRGCNYLLSSQVAFILFLKDLLVQGTGTQDSQQQDDMHRVLQLALF